MKIYRKVVINMRTGETVEEDSFEYDGPLALAFGAGASGKVDFPQYMKSFHEAWLGTKSGGFSVSTLIAAMQESPSPYYNEASYDPSPDINRMQNRYDGYNASVASLDYDADWANMVDTAVTKASGNVFPLVDPHANMSTTALQDILSDVAQAVNSSGIQSIMDAHEARAVARQQRSIARFTAGMADANAVLSSAFAIGLALRESEAENEVAEFDARLNHEIVSSMLSGALDSLYKGTTLRAEYKNRLIVDGINHMIQLQQGDISAMNAAASLQTEISRITAVLKKEQKADDLEIDVNDATWDLFLLQHGGNFLSAINGAPMIPKGLTKTQSAVGGALSGAAIGLLAAKEIGIGLLTGGIGGLIAGAAMGLLM